VQAWAFGPAKRKVIRSTALQAAEKKRALSSRAKARTLLPFPRCGRARDAARDLLFAKCPIETTRLPGQNRAPIDGSGFFQ
jgi:hypothetical protein